jgi:hypothetical protein
MTRVLAGMVALAAWGCAGLIPTPPPPPTYQGFAMDRFDKVDDQVFRSSQPSAAEWRDLVAKYHIQSVMKLNVGGEPAPPGVQVIREPLDPLRDPSDATIARILDEIDKAPKPLLIHCTHGEDRTGLIVALYKIRHKEMSVDEAYVDMVRHRFHPYDGLWSVWMRASGWNHP